MQVRTTSVNKVAPQSGVKPEPRYLKSTSFFEWKILEEQV